MNRTVLVVILSIVVNMMSAQTLYDGEPAVVYYMPQTQLCFDFEYEQVTTHTGPFAAYAKQYLGAEDVIQENSTSYRLLGVKSMDKAVVDYSRSYKVVADNELEMQLLSLTDIGTLAGYNTLPCPEEDPKPQPNREEAAGASCSHTDVLPLLEESINNKGLSQQAQGAAKLIYRIREYRMYLLGGEIDKVPADGKAMQLVLEELNKREQALVELFTGYTEVKRLHKRMNYTPVKTEETELGYFSEKEGFTNDNGEPIVLNITARRLVRVASRNEKENKKAPTPSQLYYNLPGSASYKVVYLSETLLERNAAIAQFGIAVPLAKSLFIQETLPHIIFDTKTGNIKRIDK